MSLVTTGADHVDGCGADRLGQEHRDRLGEHRLDEAADLGGGLPFGTQRYGERRDLDRGRVPCHDLAHRPASVVRRELLAAQ
jgi:hypothetical protein